MKIWLKSVAFRLIDLAALSITAYLLIYFLISTEILDTPLLFLSETFNSLPRPIAYASIFLIGFSLLLFLRKHNCYNISHTVKNDIKHLPVYFSSLSVVAFTLYNHDLMELIDPFYASLFASGIFICSVTMQIRKTSIPLEKENTNAAFDINVWLDEEAPVANTYYDLNNSHIYVNRIHDRLVSTNEKESHQIAIRGDFGTGKSSLCRLLENKAALSKEKNFIYCYIDGWGREDSSFAGQILEIIIDKLSEYVDCSSLIKVPENYVNALNGTGLNSVTVFTQLFTSKNKKNPEQHINKINEILININLHMVVVLEDFDRGPKPQDTINEMASLLERLKGLKNINFLICIKRDEATPIDKICTHIEDILPISDSTTERIINLFIQSIEEDHHDITLVGDFSNYVAPKNIGALIKTPRKLKTALRRTKSAWKSIKGEVNFFDLLHINIIRSAEPIFLTVIENAITEIRKVSESHDDNIKQSLARRIKFECDNYNLDYVAVFSIFYRLFPETLTISQLEEEYIETFRENSYASIISGSYSNKTQSITNTRGNYLYRAITESIPNEEAKDQDIIKAIDSPNAVDLTLANLSAITDEKKYESYLSGLIDWTLEIEKFRNAYCNCLAEIINHELKRLSKPKTSLFFDFDLKFDSFNKLNKSALYPLLKGVERIAKFNSAGNTDNLIINLQKSIYENILLTNSSISTQLTHHFFESHFLKEKYSKIIVDYIKTNSLSHILNSVDTTDTEFLELIFKCYKLESGDHNEDRIDPSEFHKFLFSSGFHPMVDILPMIIYHLDKSGICEMYALDGCWNKNDMRDLILNFEICTDTKYQYLEKLTKQLAKWKDYAARDFEVPLSKKATCAL